MHLLNNNSKTHVLQILVYFQYWSLWKLLTLYKNECQKMVLSTGVKPTRNASFFTSNIVSVLHLLQGTESEEADLPENSLLWPLRPARVFLGGSQKACPVNTPPACPDRIDPPLYELQLPVPSTDRTLFFIGRKKKAKVLGISQL